MITSIAGARAPGSLPLPADPGVSPANHIW